MRRRSGSWLTRGALLLAVLTITGCEEAPKEDNTAQLVQQAAAIKWGDGEPLASKLATLDALADEIDKQAAGGATDALKPSRDAYASAILAGLAGPIRASLEAELKLPDPEAFASQFEALKAYILLSDKARLATEADWLRGVLVERAYGALTKPAPTAGDKKSLERHLGALVTGMKDGTIPTAPADPAIVQPAQQVLGGVSAEQAYAARFIGALDRSKIDPSGPAAAPNLRLPPVSVASVLADRPDALAIFKSRSQKEGGDAYAVRGIYTVQGYQAVTASVKGASSEIARDKWVVEITSDAPEEAVLSQILSEYRGQYQDAWVRFIKDVTVEEAKDNPARIKLLDALLKAPPPQLRLLQAVEEHTAFKDVPADKVPASGGIKAKLAPAVRFGVPEDGGKADGTPLAQYLAALEPLRETLMIAQDANLDLDKRDFAAAKKKAEEQLKPLEGIAADLLRPLLLEPIDAITP